MGELTLFEYETGNIRAKIIDGTPWFVAKDVCDSLSLLNSSQVVERLESDEKLTYILYASGQNREMWFINESGLYSLIMRSNKPEAQKFRKWVTSVVLPSIRKTGQYNMQSLSKLQILEMAIESEKKYLSEKTISAEKTKRIDTLIHIGKLYTATEIAKEFQMRSAIELNKFLEVNEIQYKINGTWVLTARYSDKGYTSIKELELDTGQIIYDRKWTGLGRDFLICKYLKSKELLEI
jgi:prophage antirepressor-like protein